ncbi:MAG: restriction endonuclease subunit S [Bacteroidales bacterium]|nr:restriction endonuclease subunit S [Bacteroidales bacterium]
MERYSEYKDSSVYFLPRLPKEWKIRKAKYLFNEEYRPTRPDDEIVTCFRDGQVTLRKNRRIEGFTNSLKEIGYQGVRKGDLVIHNMDAFAGSIGVSDSDGKATPVYSCCTPKSDEVNQYYYCLLLRCLARNGFILSLAKGIRERSTDFRFNDFKELYLPLPSRREQNAIVAYLDKVTSKIDAAIAQQQKMIELLNERKQIIINNAVTKGLDPTAKMKPSGIDWLGNIPTHWEVRRLGSLGSFSKGGNISRDSLTEYGKEAILYGDIYTKYNIIAKNIQHFVSKKTAKESVRIYNDDIIMTGSGETKEDIGKTVVYKGDEAYIGGDVILLRTNNCNNTFISYALNSQDAKDYRYKESKGEIIVHIYPSSLKRLYIALPTLTEQHRIVEYLNRQMSSINHEISVIEQKIVLLQERKQIIINEVVTGKVKVR